ncbi:MAG: FAD-dependent monooxygenase [Phycisphaerae bacterium]
MNGKRVLIVGAGIAGPALAYWLARWGFDVLVVEIAPAPRTGGYVIDFWGAGFDVAERMGILPELRNHDVGIEELQLVDAHGRTAASFKVSVLRKLVRNRYMTLARSSLAAVLFEHSRTAVAYRFGDTVEEIHQDESGVDVLFRSGTRDRFDAVIGADGLHSIVRRLTFGDEERFTRFLGYCVAAITVDAYPHRTPHAYVTYGTPGNQVARYLMPDGRTGVLFIFEHSSHTPRERAAQVELVRETFQNEGWECAELVQAIDKTEDFYFDVVSQVRLPAWSKGRVALLGDAASCPSLISGQGSALAIAGAYVLAGELRRAAGEWSTGFQQYEKKLRSFIEGKQNSAGRFAASFVPDSRWGIWMRNQVTRLMRFKVVARWVFRRYMEDRVSFEEYG